MRGETFIQQRNQGVAGSSPVRSRNPINNKKMADISKHSFVPKHIKLTEEEVLELLKKYNMSLKQLPKISSKDPAIKEMDAKKGEIIKIIRNSKTNKEAVFYRAVIGE